MDRNDPNLVEQTVKDIVNYVNLRSDRFNLSMIENLSVLVSTLFGVLIAVLLGSIALGFAAVALTWGLSMLLGSLLIATLIIASLFVIAAVIVYRKRQTLIVDNMVRMLAKMITDISRRGADDEKS